MIMSSLVGSGFTPGTTPPAGPPTNGQQFTYAGGALIGLYWTKGDPLAETEITYLVEPGTPNANTPVFDKVAPNVTTYDTGEAHLTIWNCWWYVRHKRGGQVTAWERCEHPDNLITCAGQGGL